MRGLWTSNWPHFYQTRSAWSVDQGSTRKCSAVRNFAPRVTKFCVMWGGLSLPHDTTFGNCRGEIADRRMIFIWSLIHGSSWSGLIKVGPGLYDMVIVFPNIICHDFSKPSTLTSSTPHIMQWHVRRECNTILSKMLGKNMKLSQIVWII